jgi:hypothetical protein
MEIKSMAAMMDYGQWLTVRGKLKTIIPAQLFERQFLLQGL